MNSFITKSSGTWGKADKDLAKQVKGEEVEKRKNAKEMIGQVREKLGKDAHAGDYVKDFFYESFMHMLHEGLPSTGYWRPRKEMKCIMHESWYHITKTNGMHEPHTHLGCSWCGIYYVQSGDEGSGETVFRSPIESTYIDRGNSYLDDRRTIRLIPKDGYLVIFPSYLIHHQALYKGDKDRIVVAFISTIN